MKPAPAKPPRLDPRNAHRRVLDKECGIERAYQLDPAKLAVVRFMLTELRSDAMVLRARIEDILAALKTNGVGR